MRGAKGGISFESFTGFAYFLPIFIAGVKEANIYIRTAPDWTSDFNSIGFGIAVLLITIMPRISAALAQSSPKYFKQPLLLYYYVLYCMMTVKWLGKAPPAKYLAGVVGIVCMWCLPNAMLKMELKAQEECSNFVPPRDSPVTLPAIASSMVNCYYGLYLGMAVRPTIACQGNINGCSYLLFFFLILLMQSFIGVLGILLDEFFAHIKRVIPPYMCRSFLPVSISLFLFLRPVNSDIEGENMQNIWNREIRMATYVYILIALLMNLPVCSVQRILDPALFLFGLTLVICV